jgi:hypothetical protein
LASKYDSILLKPVLGLIPPGQVFNDAVFYFQGFHHPAYDNNKSVWSLESVPLLRKFTFAIQDADRNALVNTIIDAFETAVMSVIDSMEKGKCCGVTNIFPNCCS